MLNKNRYIINFVLIFYLLIPIIGNSQLAKTFNYITDYQLEDIGAYSLIFSNESYIVFFEYHGNDLHIIDLKEDLEAEKLNENLKKYRFGKGGGPGEIAMPVSMDIEGNTVAISDMANGKVLFYNIISEEINEIFIDKYIPYAISLSNDKLLIADYTKDSNVYNLYDIQSDSIVIIGNEYENIYKERLRIFSEEGVFTSGGGHFYFFKRYVPQLLKFDRNLEVIESMTQYEEAKVSDSREIKFNSQTAYGPPEVSILLNDAEYFSENKFLLLLESKTDKYRSDIIYMYNQENEKIFPVQELRNVPIELTFNGKYLITLSNIYVDGENTLSIYQLD